MDTADFPILEKKIHGKRLIYLDNAATTQKPNVVISALSSFYREHNANINRGVYLLSEEATRIFDESRKAIGNFINAEDDGIVFTKGATEGINLVMRSWGEKHIKRGDEIIVSIAEHHANFVPWQVLAKKKGARLIVIPITKDGVIDIRSFEKGLSKRTRLVALIHMSNVLGTTNPISPMIRIIKKYNKDIITLIDAAQSVSHMPIDVRELGCDFLVFSGHKMLGPSGIGVLYGKKEHLIRMDPFLYGGDMIDVVSLQSSTWAEVPRKFEAGTQNPAAAYALAAAVSYLGEIGMGNVQRYCHDLGICAWDLLAKTKGVSLQSPRENAGIISFTVKGIHPHDVASILDGSGIAVRAGHHCAQPLMAHLGVQSTCRASFYVYNTEEDALALKKGIEKAQRMFHGP